jgi:dihydroflavonol-4-reductase
MRILLTGGHGFIGARLTALLVDQGHALRCLVRATSDVTRIAGLPWERALGDVRDRSSLAAAMAGCDALVHLAAISGWDDHRSPELGPVIDAGTRNVLEVAEALGLRRAVHVSSLAAINGSSRPQLFDEGATFTLAGRGLRYAEAKVESERHAREIAARGRLEVVIVNPAETYGPGDDRLVTAQNLLDPLRSWPALACAGGTSVVHVDDVAAGIAAALERGRSGERYILGGDNLSVPALIRLTLRVAGQRKPVVRLPRALLRRGVRLLDRLGLPTPMLPEVLDYATLYWFADNRRAREELGLRFRPAQVVLSDTLRWLVEAGHLRAEQAPALASS